MKLSEKGLGKLYNSKACYYDPDTEEEVVALSYFEHVFEFEPDDFQNCVVLTVEEAEILTRCAANEFCRLIMEHAPVDLARQVEVLMYDLVKRIKQAEKCDVEDPS